MCGQLGYSGTKPFDIEKIKLLTLWNSLERGEDATGFYSPLNGHNRTLNKGSDVVIHNNFKLIPDTILMAHVRAKTIGLNTLENTHPFKRGDWYLQHNGTLKNHLDLAHKYELSTMEYSVDSDVICGAISKQDNISVLKEIDGPAAIIIHKTTMPNKLFVFRNTERPLFRGMIDGCMYISSIKESLIYIGCESVKEFKVDTVYTICDGIVEKTVKINNTPYRRPFINTGYNNTTYGNYNTNSGYYNSFVQPNELVNSWLRANFNDTSTTRKFKLIQDKFYFICGATEFGMLEVKEKDEDNSPVETYHKSYFNTNDYLEIWDTAVALYDIVDDKKEVVIDIDELVTITKVNNNILSLENYNTKKDICNADRRYFRAATDLEIRTYKNTNTAVNDYTSTDGYYEGYYDAYDSYNTPTTVHPVIKDITKHNTTPMVNHDDFNDADTELDIEEVITNTDSFFTNLDVELQMLITILSKGECSDTFDVCETLKQLKTNAETMHYQLLTMDQKL